MATRRGARQNKNGRWDVARSQTPRPPVHLAASCGRGPSEAIADRRPRRRLRWGHTGGDGSWLPGPVSTGELGACPDARLVGGEWNHRHGTTPRASGGDAVWGVRVRVVGQRGPHTGGGIPTEGWRRRPERRPAGRTTCTWTGGDGDKWHGTSENKARQSTRSEQELRVAGGTGWPCPSSKTRHHPRPLRSPFPH